MSLTPEALAQIRDLIDDARPREFSDDCIATAFTDAHRGDLRFEAERGRWLKWDGNRWADDKTRHAFDLVREICREQSRRSQNDPRVSTQLASARTVAAVHRLAQADQRTAAVVAQWDTDPWLLNTPAGVVDLRTGVGRQARPEDYMTKITAAAPGGACPRFMRFLSEITVGDADLEAFLQRALGYSLTGDTREHSLFFGFGMGANGKGTLLNTIAHIMGDYHHGAPIELFTASSQERHPTDLANLVGARLVTVTETERGRKWAEARIKQLTGGDIVTAHFMRQDPFDYVPQLKLWISGNHKPRLSAVDEAIRRRFKLVPFLATFSADKCDMELPEKLKAEAGGILQWLIEGCTMWLRQGLAPPAAVTAATREYLESQDIVPQWLDECCTTGNKLDETALASLYMSFKEWAEAAGERPGRSRDLSDKLDAMGFDKLKRMKGVAFQGIRLGRNG